LGAVRAALDLAQYVEISINTLISKKDICIKANQQATVAVALRKEKDSTQKVSAAVKIIPNLRI
jgi:hypothetical protein